MYKKFIHISATFYKGGMIKKRAMIFPIGENSQYSDLNTMKKIFLERVKINNPSIIVWKNCKEVSSIDFENFKNRNHKGKEAERIELKKVKSHF